VIYHASCIGNLIEVNLYEGTYLVTLASQAHH